MNKRILFSLLVIYFLSLTLTQIITTDTWWNLADGRAFFSSWSFPRVDHYSYVTEGQKWINGFWLSGVILYPVYVAGGAAMLTALKVIVVGFVFFLLQTIRNRNAFGIILTALTLSLLAGGARFQVRSEMFGFLCQGIFLWLMYRYQCGMSVRTMLAAAVLTMIFWVNVHPSFLVGFLIGAAFLMGEPAAWLLERSGKMTPEPYPISGVRYLKLLGIFAVAFLATTVNPYGFEIWKLPYFFVKHHNYAAANISEWQPVSLFWIRFSDPLTLAAMALILIFGVAGIIWNVKKTSISWCLLWFLSVAMFLSSVRHASFFAMVSVPVLILNWSDAAERFRRIDLTETQKSRAKTAARYGAILLSLVMTVVIFDRVTDRSVIACAQYEAFGFDFYRRALPEEAVRFARENKLPGRIFNSYDLGSYIMYHWPGEKVFIDTRLHFRGAEDFERYLDVMRKPEEHWEKLAAQYGIQTVILKHISRDVDLFLPYLFRHPEWAVVYGDHKGVVFVKRAVENTLLIERLTPNVDLKGLFEKTEWLYKPHWFGSFTISLLRPLAAPTARRTNRSVPLDQAPDRRPTKRRSRPIKRPTGAWPNGALPPISAGGGPAHQTLFGGHPFVPWLLPREIPFELYWVARLYFLLGWNDKAEASFIRLLDYVPTLPDFYYFLGKISVAKKDFNEAIRRFEQALALKPDFTPAREELKLSQTLVNFRVVHPS